MEVGVGAEVAWPCQQRASQLLDLEVPFLQPQLSTHHLPPS